MPDYLGRLIAKPQLSRKRQPIPIPATIRVNSNIEIKVPQARKIPPAPAAKQKSVVPGVAAPAPSVVPSPVRQGRNSLRNLLQRNKNQKPPQAPQRQLVRPGVEVQGAPDRVKPPPASQVVNKKHRPLGKKDRKNDGRKPGEVKYITADVSHYDINAIRNIRGRGAGKILVIVGNGPSLLEINDLAMLKGQYNVDTMSINKPEPRLWPTTYWSFFDVSQLRRHRALWESYSGTLFNSTSIKEKKPGTVTLKNLGGKGFSKDLSEGFHIGRSSVYASMQIGLWLDYAHIYILGCDMSQVTINGIKRMHFYGINPDVDPDTRNNRFDAEAEYYVDGAGRMTDDERARFTFCSSYNQYQFVDKFNKMDHLSAVQTILSRSRSLVEVVDHG